MNENQTGATAPTIETPSTDNQVVVATPLAIILGDNISKVEFNGVVSESNEDKVAAIRGYIRNKVLKQFGVVEVAKTAITGGKLYMNEGNRTNLKLPAVKETPTGAFAESLEQYYNRAKPTISKWLVQSFQNSGITMEEVGKLA